MPSRTLENSPPTPKLALVESVKTSSVRKPKMNSILNCAWHVHAPSPDARTPARAIRTAVMLFFCFLGPNNKTLWLFINCNDVKHMQHYTGPFEAGFGEAQSRNLEALGCSDPSDGR